MDAGPDGENVAVDRVLTAFLVVLPLHTVALLLLDRVGLRGTPFRLAQNWYEVVAVALLVVAAAGGAGVALPPGTSSGLPGGPGGTGADMSSFSFQGVSARAGSSRGQVQDRRTLMPDLT